MSGVQRGSLRASQAISTVRSWHQGVSVTAVAVALRTHDSSQSPDGLLQSFQTFKQLLGKPEMHLKPSQNLGPEALKANPQPGHRQCLFWSSSGLSGPRPRSSMTLPQGHPCPTESWELLLCIPAGGGTGASAADISGSLPPINHRIHSSPITHRTWLWDQ